MIKPLKTLKDKINKKMKANADKIIAKVSIKRVKSKTQKVAKKLKRTKK